MYDFNYHRPQALAQAIAVLETYEEAKPLAGGMSLLPSLKLRLTRYSDLVDLKRIAALRGIRRDGDSIVIGAMTPHAVVGASEVVRQAIPGLAFLAGQIGDPLVRNRGTIGGSIANADPSSDYPSSVLGLGATVITHRREIAGDAFFLGLFETALQPGEVITAVRFPIPLACGYMKLPQPASRFAMVGVFVTRTPSGVRVAVTGARAAVFRVPELERALDAEFSATALDGIELDPAGMNSDIHASPEYRAHAIVVMTKRVVTALAAG